MNSEPVRAVRYEWFSANYQHWIEIGYCATTICDRSPGQVLDTLDADRRSKHTGVADLHVAALDAWDERGGGPFGRLLVAVTAVGTATLMVEVNGFIGNTDALMAPLSRERGVASHYRGAGLDRFSWWVGGALELGFEAPTLAEGCFGTHPDKYFEDMADAGFNLDGSFQGSDHSVHAAFALAEQLTGVAVTESILATADFEWGNVQTVH